MCLGLTDFWLIPRGAIRRVGYIVASNPVNMRLNTFFSFLAAAGMTWMVAASAVAQTDASPDPQGPWIYNPDANANGNIATYDLMELLAIFGQDVDVPVVVPAETVDELTQQVAWLTQVVELQAQRMAAVVHAIREIHREEAASPFVWDEALGAWVCSAPVVVQEGLSASSIHTNRITAGSGKFGGMGVE